MGAMRRRLHRDIAAVTPVVGTLLILAITVLGITAVMVWGAPSIQRIQDQNTQTAMLGEFDNLQEISTVLQVPDASRLPRIVQGAGSFGFEPGNRYLITADHDSSNPDCDLRVTGWGEAPANEVEIEATSCRTPQESEDCDPPGGGEACLEIHRVTGANTVKMDVEYPGGDGGDGTYEVVDGAGNPVDFSQGDWLFRLTDGDAPTPVVYAQAWLLSSDRIAWELSSNVGDRGVYLDGGAVFTQQGRTTFLERSPPLHEGIFATDVYALFLRTMDADRYTSITGQSSFQMFLGLTTQSARIADDGVYTIRYDIEGDLSEAWCQSLLLRNSDTEEGDYTLDTGATCQDDVPSVKYEKDPKTAFTFHFIHGEIRTSLFN